MVVFLRRGARPEKVGERCLLCRSLMFAQHWYSPLVFARFLRSGALPLPLLQTQRPHQIASDSQHACVEELLVRCAARHWHLLVTARAERAGSTRSTATGGGGGMGGWPRPGKAPAPAPRSLLLALALCCLLARPQPSRAFFFGMRTSAHVPHQQRGGGGGGGGREEKVPMTVVVPDYSPRPAPLGPSPSVAPAPAPAPVPGSDGGGDDDEDGTPRLPSERRSTGAGARSSADRSARAQAPGGATSADFISSSPAVPLPAGVTDSATVLPMPSPGRQQLRDDVGMGTLRLQVRALQLAVPLLMMLSFGASVSVGGAVL